MPDLLLPPGIRYTCIQCGACCRTLEVTLTEQERERLAAHDWTAELDGYAAERYFAPIPGARGKQTWRLRPLPSGACRFLADDGLCRVHGVLGYKAKPFAGRLFPFTFTVTPIGVFVGVRFNCPAVVRGKGPELEKQRHDIQRLYDEYARIYSPPVAPARVRYHGRFELAWPDVLRLEDQLLAFLLTRDLPVAQRLLACHRLVHSFLGKAGQGADGQRVGVEPDEILAEAAMPAAAAELSRMEHALLRLLAATFLGATLPSFRELTLARRTRHRAANLGLRLRLAFGRGALRLPGTEVDVAVAEIASVAAEPLGVPATQMLERYFVAKVTSQGFFGGAFFGRSFVGGIDFLVAAYQVILWLARAHALASGRTRVADDDVDYAIRRVDYGFNYAPAFGGSLDRLRAFLFRQWGTEEKLLGGGVMRDA